MGDEVDSFMIEIDEDDEYEGDYFYGCTECIEGFYVENMTCFPCASIDPDCKACDDGDFCDVCKDGYILEYLYTTKNAGN